MLRFALVLTLLAGAPAAFGQNQPGNPALRHSVEQLRASIGKWNVTTDFLKHDGTVAKSATGTYEFSWVVPDRVVAGRSDIPELKQTAGLLFYVNEAQKKIEMASVGGDGKLWIMSGPLGGEVRTTQPYMASGGGAGRLRFTRSKVTDQSFESRMEYTEDDGRTWTPGNHQRFRRAAPGKP